MSKEAIESLLAEYDMSNSTFAKDLREALAEQPAQREFVSPGGGYVPAIPAQQRPIKTFHGGKAWPVQEPAQQEPVLQDIEQYRMQIGGICTAAIGYWKEGDGIHPDYDTVALRNVAQLYAKYDELYRAQPAQRKPLTDEQFQAICDRLSRQGGWDGDGWDLALKEAIEAAHGIKENT